MKIRFYVCFTPVHRDILVQRVRDCDLKYLIVYRRSCLCNSAFNFILFRFRAVEMEGTGCHRTLARKPMNAEQSSSTWHSIGFTSQRSAEGFIRETLVWADKWRHSGLGTYTNPLTFSPQVLPFVILQFSAVRFWGVQGSEIRGLDAGIH